MAEHAVYGALAEFKSPDALVAAARNARSCGYSALDAFTPFPVTELYEVLGLHDRRVFFLGLFGGFFGAAVAILMQVYVNADFPLNVGGRDLFAWPAFAVVTFELTVLFGALFPAIGMIALNGLPQLYHPVFNAGRFARASKDSFFLCIEASDPRFEADATVRFLNSLNPEAVELVSA